LIIEVDVGHGHILEMNELGRLMALCVGRGGIYRSCVAVVAEFEEVPLAAVGCEGVDG
jgi:hypothetical protein